MAWFNLHLFLFDVFLLWFLYIHISDPCSDLLKSFCFCFIWMFCYESHMYITSGNLHSFLFDVFIIFWFDFCVYLWSLFWFTQIFLLVKIDITLCCFCDCYLFVICWTISKKKTSHRTRTNIYIYIARGIYKIIVDTPCQTTSRQIV